MAIEAEKNIDLYLQNSNESGISEERVLEYFPDLPVRVIGIERKMELIIKKGIDPRKREQLLKILLEDIEGEEHHSSFEGIFGAINNGVNSLIERYGLYLETSDCLGELYGKLIDFQKEVEKKGTYSKEAIDLLQLYEQDFQGKMYKVIKAEMRRVSKLITVGNDTEDIGNKRKKFKNKLLSLVGMRNKKES